MINKKLMGMQLNSLRIKPKQVQTSYGYRVLQGENK